MSGNRSARRTRAAADRRRLQLERLEDRSLMAVAAFSVNLYEDVNGAPGELISSDTVAPGQQFFLEILATEHDPLVTGLQGVALDIAWNPQAIEIVDAELDH